MIQEGYVSFETAKLLEEKGFNEPCNGRYSYRGGNVVVENYPISNESLKYHPNIDGISAPTHQMAMAWLREKHIIFVFKPASFSGEDCTSWTYEIWAGDNFEGEILSFKTYEEAVEAACLYVLKNLI